jgi:hypothetical protein
LLLALALGFAGVLAASYRDTKLELARLDAASGLLGAPRAPARVVPKERLEAEVKSAEAVVRQLTVPWGSLVQALEQAATRDVAVLALQPDAENRLLRLTAQATHREAMFEYMRRLAAAKALGDVHMVSHQIVPDDPQQPIQFSLQAALKAMP